MSTDIAPLETLYAGVRFRSRLEARWAVYFDALGIAWEYEKEGYDLGGGLRYLPDFWLPQVRMWAEVKPREFSDVELDKARRLVDVTGWDCLLLVGVPEARTYDALLGEPSGPAQYDFVLGTGYLHEHRFYSASGMVGEVVEDPDVRRAVAASRAFRFDEWMRRG